MATWPTLLAVGAMLHAALAVAPPAHADAAALAPASPEPPAPPLAQAAPPAATAEGAELSLAGTWRAENWTAQVLPSSVRVRAVNLPFGGASTVEQTRVPVLSYALVQNASEATWTFLGPSDLRAGPVTLVAYALHPSAASSPAPGGSAPPLPAPAYASPPLPAPSPTSPAPLPAPSHQHEPARAPAWAPPPEAVGIRRPLGLLQALRDVLAALLAALRAAGALLLYHRVSASRALDHPLRSRLHALVIERPGLHVAALAEALGAHPKTLGYHLRVLARSGMVRLAPEGRTVRVLPMAAVEGAPPDASRTRERAVALLRQGRALTRDDLAGLLGITPQAVSYHLDVLRRQGRVRVHWLGRWRRYEAV